jgi:acetylornithine deacetylase
VSELSELVGQLVAIDSVNPDLVPGGAGEGEIARFVAGWLEGAGVEVALEETAPGRPNVVAVVRGTGGGRSLMLNAHMDTVGFAGMAQPLTPTVEGNRLHGRGAYDMKGSLAAIMLVAAAARQRSLRGDLIITAVTDEEYASLGTQDVVRRWTADAAIVTEPSALNLCVAHKGFVWLDIETAGVAAHGSRPDLGVDAIAKMGPILTGIVELDRSLRAAPSHPLLQSGSLHASLIEGGQELSSYPERCLLRVERRTIPGETTELVEAQLQAILDRARVNDPTFVASVRSTLTRPPFEVSTDAPIVQTLRAQATTILGREPAVEGVFAWMDSAMLSAAGIPTVIFGPGGAGAHAVVEWVDLDQVDQCTQILLATAKVWCG